MSELGETQGSWHLTGGNPHRFRFSNQQSFSFIPRMSTHFTHFKRDLILPWMYCTVYRTQRTGWTIMDITSETVCFLLSFHTNPRYKLSFFHCTIWFLSVYMHRTGVCVHFYHWIISYCCLIHTFVTLRPTLRHYNLNNSTSCIVPVHRFWLNTKYLISLGLKQCRCWGLWPLLLTWINFNPCM